MAASVAGNLIEGAALGAALQRLFTEVQATIELACAFKGELENLDKKLTSVKPIIKNMMEANMELDLSLLNTTNFEAEMNNGMLLVAECKSYTKKLRKFEKYLDELGKILGLQLGVDNLAIAGGVKAIVERLEKQENMAPARMVRDRGGVPQPPQFVIGLDKLLGELKMKILREDDWPVLVLTAPAGYGKTTLAQKLCHDPEIQAKFKSIMFVRVSKTPDLSSIVQQLYEQQHLRVPSIRDEEDASACLKRLLMEIGQSPMLLVLDDVWLGSESLIKEFSLPIPEYKILVTSRSKISGFGSPKVLEKLNDEDATTLLRCSAMLEDGSSNNPTDDVVIKVVQHCMNVPLALILVGALLQGKPQEIWERKVEEWSEESSVLSFEDKLLNRLKSSLDFLGEKDVKLKECFMDLASFPEDKRIPAAVLIDVWTELHGLKESHATANLFELHHWNMANVVITRRDAYEKDGYYGEHFVTQHDMLRELAIHQSKQEESENRRKRLILDGNNLPNWWNEPNELTFNARLVSITTDGNFSSKWCNMNLPEVEVLILNFQSENYALPDFLKTMSKLKVLIITNHGFFPAKLSNFELLGSLTNLKRIRFEHVVIPPLSQTSITLENLQKLSLFMCTVGQAFDSIQRSKPFPKLEELNIDYCKDFVALPAEFCVMVKNVLRKLSITHCHKLSTLPEEIGEMDHLEVLRLRSSIELKSLPDSICSLSSLKVLDISDCFSIRNLPEEIGNLSRLEKLNMKGCSRLPELPPSVVDFERLKEVVCDEELEELWESYLPSHGNTSLKVAKEDINLNWLENLQS